MWAAVAQPVILGFGAAFAALDRDGEVLDEHLFNLGDWTKWIPDSVKDLFGCCGGKKREQLRPLRDEPRVTDDDKKDKGAWAKAE